MSQQPTAPPIAVGQWRLAEIQVANWGTFDGAIYRFPIARKGHLITGPSGSGKSSLLDAIAAVLTPDKWLRFNLAAQGSGTKSKQRTLMSYVRGAWSGTTNDLDDRVVSAFLRTGATWSGILLRYENERERPITLGRLFFVKGTGTAPADLSDLCLIERSELDLRALEPYVRSRIDTRRILEQWPQSVVTTNGSHARFYARMRSLLGIERETALQLLHKTQAAKSLGSLDQLFCDYMLDRPATFELADTAVAQFGGLRDVHDHLVQLREQRDHLEGLRAASQALDAAENDAKASRSLAESVLPFQTRRGLELARQERSTLDERIGLLEADADRAKSAAEQAAQEFEAAHRRTLDLGGSDVDQLRLRIRGAREAEKQTIERWERLARQLAEAGVDLAPETSAEFVELMTEIDRQLTAGDAPGPTREELRAAAHAEDELTRIDGEIDSLRRSRSTVPAALLDIRRDIASATGVPVTALPYAAELLTVRREFEGWTSAIERVLRPLALTLLVPSEHLAAVRRWVDGHDMGVRLAFEEVTAQPLPARPARTPISLVNRVEVSGGRFADWLRGVLSERFDVACVESLDGLDDHVAAVTMNGQIKTAATSYLKDDRLALDDRSHWVLGDRDAKLEALIVRRLVAEADYRKAGAIVAEATRRRSEADRRMGILQAVREHTWREIDREAAAAFAFGLERQLAEAVREDGDLEAAIRTADAARDVRDELAKAFDEIRVDLLGKTKEREALTDSIEAAEKDLDSGAVPPVSEEDWAALDERFRAVHRAVTRASIAEIGQKVSEQLHRQRDESLGKATVTGAEVQRLITEFADRWPASSADLTPAVADRQGYLELLDKIVVHELPEYEARFMRLLRDRSRDLMGDLVSDILAAPREIEERVHPVNTSLRTSAFDEGRFLRLRVKTRRSDTVMRFIADLRSISEDGWGEENPENAERRFNSLAELMRRFDSSDPLDRAWKTQCLDTRLHVTFLAEEIDEHDRVQATYDSGATMSGGQQQKLVVFCLAAALRYQLADPQDKQTRYGTIILDEAFDKADTRYTRMALDVFVAFGFQLVLATPQKLLQTIEPYVGAATSIENPTRRRSEVARVQWNEYRE